MRSNVSTESIFKRRMLMTASKDKPIRPLRKTSMVLITIQCILTALFILMFIYLDLSPLRYTVILSALLILLIGLIILLSRWNGGRFVACIISVIVSISLGYGVYLMNSTSNLLQSITSVNTEKHTINVYVRADDPAQSIENTGDYTYGILNTLGRDNTDESIYKISELINTTLTVKTYSSITEMLDGLLSGKCDAIILNESYITMVSEIDGYSNIESRIRVIYSNVVERKVTSEETTGKTITEDSFIVYVSGIDTTGSISAASRSDVNILMAVNPADKRILLLSTPRDYYIPLSISGGTHDKLTHAGRYGINVSMDTLKMLYETDIDYYIRLNFTSFVKIIDALGGIRVYSDYSFSTKSYSFKKGYNNMNGAQALEFARERYSFAEGDRQRGKNQMAVIQGVIEKVTSAAVLSRYSSLLSSVQSSIQTNISTTEIGSLVKQQLNDMKGWNISTYSVDGTGSSEYTYSIPNQRAYVMIPDVSTVDEAKLKLKEIME
jgi:LCP family protein required for cell wall assembly